MVIRELTYQLHKLEASESALVSADHHDKKLVLGIGGKNPDRSIPTIYSLCRFTRVYTRKTIFLAYLHGGTAVPHNNTDFTTF